MNIFALDINPSLAAQYHANKHLSKMILESAQLLCTAHHVLDGANCPFLDLLYKKTHTNHPSALWVRESKENYMWLFQLMLALNNEWQFRYGHTVNHKTIDKLASGTTNNLSIPPQNIPNIPQTPFAIVMPDEYKDIDAVVSYRNYYRDGKKDLLEFGKRGEPSWL